MSALARSESSQRRTPRGGPAARGPARDGPAGAGPAGPAGRRPEARRPPGRAPEGGDRLHRLAGGFVAAFLEVECGRRPREQLYPLLCPQLAARLAGTWVRPGPLGTVVRTYGRRITPGRYEAVAVVHRGGRYGALAVALAHTGSCWVVLDAARPEDGWTLAPRTPAR